MILIGAGTHAHACIDVIEQHGQFQIAGLVGLPLEVNNLHFDYSVIDSDEGLLKQSKKYNYALVTVGQIQSPERRISLFNLAQKLGFELPVIISPYSHVSRHSKIGSGTIVMHGAIVNAGAIIGNNCIINSRALIEHGTIVEDHCHISTGAILNGNVVVGEGSFVGSGSIIKESITLGKRCVVGMGLSVRLHQPDKSRFLGILTDDK